MYNHTLIQELGRVGCTTPYELSSLMILPAFALHTPAGPADTLVRSGPVTSVHVGDKAGLSENDAT